MGALFEDIKKLQAQRGNKSRIVDVMEKLSKEDAADLKKALDDHEIPASNISRAMAKRGHKLAPDVINRYRRGELATDIK